MSKFLIRNNKGISAILLALFLPVLISSIYFCMKFVDRAAQYTQKDCSAEAVLQAVKKYNFGMKFSDQKAYLLSIADSVYNDWTIKNNGTPIEYIATSITYNQYATSSKNGQEYNQFISLYYSVDGAYRNNLFTNTDYCSECNYNTNNFKVANILIPNDALNKNSYLELPLSAANITTYNECPSGISYKPIAFEINKAATGANTIQVFKRKEESSIINLTKDASSDKLTLQLTQPVSKEVYTATAVPAKCNVDIALCIPTNSAACNASNLDEASPTANQAIKTSTGDLSDISNAPIFQISQACKYFLANNFLNTQGTCIALVPYSGKISLPHYCDIGGVGVDFRVFNMRHCTNKTGLDIVNKAYGYELYGLCGDPSQRLDAFQYGDCLDNQPYWCNPWVRAHKYGFPLMYQIGIYDLDSKGFVHIQTPVDISNILSGNSEDNYNAFYIANMYPPYLGYTNFLRGKAEIGTADHPASTEFQPNPYYMIPLTPDVLKICDLLECFRPINDPKNVSNFCFLPFIMSDYLLNYSAIGDVDRTTSDNYFSQDSKTKSGRHKAIIVFINKPDHFEPGELTYLGFSNDNNQFYFGESDCIKFNTNYSSTDYKFVDNTTLASESSGVNTSTSNLDIKGTKKILRFKQISGTLQKDGTDYSYYWTVPEGVVTKATLKFPEKHLIKLVFEGDYQSSEPTIAPGSITFYSDNGVSECRRDSSSGSPITLGSANTFNSSTTFVFKGSSYPSAQQAANAALLDYAGPNFGLNVSPYKVKYSISKAAITKAVLRNQVIRGYNGALYRSVEALPPPQFITSDGYKLTTTPYNMIAYGETAQDYTWTSLSSTQLEKFNRFNDACVRIADYNGTYRLMNDTVPNTDWQTRFLLDNSTLVLYMDFYGFTNAQWFASLYSGYRSTNIFKIGEQTGIDTYSTTNPSTIRYTWDNPFTVLGYSNSTYYSNKLRMRITSGCSLSALYGMALMNIADTKELSQTSTVSSSTLNMHMSDNSYIDLFYTSSNINDVSSGNWICFQGDGDLEVTVEPNTYQNQGLAITNLKNTDGVTVITEDDFTFPKRKIIYIETTSISDNKDSDGDYHLDLTLSNVRLVSAEITNRTYQKITPTVTYSATSTTKADDKVEIVDTSSYTSTTTVTGDTTRVYKVISNTDRPLVINLEASEAITTSYMTEPKTNVTFYTSNGVSSCKQNSSSGSTVELDSPYTISGSTTFFFKGHTYNTATQASNNSVSTYAGPNFGLNVSPYKVRYTLNNARINTVILKNQALRAYNGCIGRGFIDIPYQILRNGKKLTEPPFHMGALGGYEANGTVYTWSALTTQQLDDFNQFNDSCVNIASCTAPYKLQPDTGRSDTHTTFLLNSSTSEAVVIEFSGLTSGKWYASIHSGYRETNLFHIGAQTGANTYEYDVSNIYHDWLTPFIIFDDFSSTYYTNKVRIRTYCGRAACYIYNMTVANYSQTKSLYSTNAVSSSTLASHMAANSYIDLFYTSSTINDTPAGNWICFQGDGDLYVTVTPEAVSPTTGSSISYKSSYTKEYAKQQYQINNRNFPYLFYTLGNGATEITDSIPASGTSIRISPNNTTFTRDSNDNYVYTLTLKNAKISSIKFCENALDSTVDMSKHQSFVFPDPSTPANNRNISLYKAKSFDSDLVYMGCAFPFFSERLYPYISYGSNSTYDISSSYGNIYPLKYHADGTIIINPFSEATCFPKLATTLYPEYTIDSNRIYIPGYTRIFSQFSRETPSYSRFYLDNTENSSKSPYSSWFEIQGVHFTLPDNYALTSYLYHHPEDTPSDKYDQDAILRKVTQRCANTLKSKSNTKIYIIKFRKQDQYKTFPLYNASSTNTNWDYSYLDSCANNVFECSSEEDLKATLEVIAKQIKNDAGYDDAHCI